MKSKIHTYRYGTPRRAGEGLRIGVTRHLPRGIRREDWARLGYFDVRVPLLAPSADLLSRYKSGAIDFKALGRHYLKQMKAPESRHVIELLAAVSRSQPVSVGCFCEDESTCHRSLLLKLIRQEVARQGWGFARLKA